ncbi:MAG: hypothetical protein MK212_17150 [Saprospiraceae bacterium]|nr:hypothetical protein [Saprospiraceae bacterium]
MFRFIYLFIYFLFCGQGIIAAQSTSIQFKVKYQQTPLKLNNSYTYNSNRLQIDVLRFYISNLEFYKQGEVVFSEIESYHLVDWADAKSCQFNLNTSQDLVFDEIRFVLGIDEQTHEAGVMGGDLDPTQGMYWSWQSGYINLKLEGTHQLIPQAPHAFQFHLGGYQAPFYNAQIIQLACASTDNIQIHLNLDQLLDKNDWATQYSIMSPSEKAVVMSKLVSELFTTAKTE